MTIKSSDDGLLPQYRPLGSLAVGALSLGFAVSLSLSGCEDGTVIVPAAAPTHTLGGTISGLPSTSSGLVISDAGRTFVVKPGVTTFTLAESAASGTPYVVMVQSSPAGTTCSIVNGSGVVGNADISNVVVTCSTQAFTIGGGVSGLNDSGLVLQNGADTVAIPSGSTLYTMPLPVAYGSSYAVSVKTEPAGANCSVNNGSGTVATSNITNIAVLCSDNPFTLGGTISGLSVTGLVLANGTDTVAVPVNATRFTLPTGVTFSAHYSVTVKSQPAGLTCTVSSATGTMPASNVTSVVVVCAAKSYVLGGSITGLTTGGLVLANGTDTKSVAANATTFLMPTAVAYGSAYAVTVQTQPTGLTCTPSSSTGTMPANDVASVTVTCAANAYTLGGSISGLVVNGLVLANGSDLLSVAANATTFTMPTAVAYGAAYNVTVHAQPQHYTCSVSGGAGTMGAQAVTSVAVSCAANPGYAYSGDYNNGRVVTYTVDLATNLLSSSPVSSIPAGQTPFDVQVDPTSTHAYVINRDDSTISEYSINSTNGALTSIGTIVMANTHSKPVKMALNAAGTYAYVANHDAGTVSIYSIGTDGLLTELAGSPYAPGSGTLTWLTVNPAGTVLYATAEASQRILVMSIDASTGGLTLSSIKPAGSGPWAIVVNAANTYAYTAYRYADAVDEFTIGAQGALTYQTSIATTGDQPVGMAIDPAGKFVYTANNNSTTNSVSGYKIGSTGLLSAAGSVPTALYPSTVTVNPAGTALYVVNNGSSINAISIFSIDPTTGGLTSIGGASAPSGGALNSLAFASP